MLRRKEQTVASDWSHHDVKSLPLEPGPLGQLVGIELRGRVPHKFWFEDVAAEAVWLKAALVDLHLFGGSLEVQRHWWGESSQSETLASETSPMGRCLRVPYRSGIPRSTWALGCSWRSRFWSPPGRSD